VQLRGEVAGRDPGTGAGGQDRDIALTGGDVEDVVTRPDARSLDQHRAAGRDDLAGHGGVVAERPPGAVLGLEGTIRVVGAGVATDLGGRVDRTRGGCETRWMSSGTRDATGGRTRTVTDAVQVIVPRDVPLGGLRAMTVRRTLPSRERAFVGAWCFVDHYGPDDVHGPHGTGGMDVAPHPHTGLQTVSWLFAGEVEHRDSAGVHAMVRPGELNLMTAGRGIAHSEVSTAETRTLHGVQLWVVLPEADAATHPDFQHHVPELLTLDGATARVFVGSLAGVRSPVRTATPLLGVQLDLDPDAVLVDTGSVVLEGVPLARGELGVSDVGPAVLELRAGGDGPARMVLLGGTSFDEPIVMWWNFIGRSHEEIAEYREEWEKIAQDADGARFGVVPGYVGEVDRIPAPALPNVRLRPRTRSGARL
jgi:redox-sensitive bicupin YhaK (pirin superfamily)